MRGNPRYTDAERVELKRVADENSTPDEVDCSTLMYMNTTKKYKELSDTIKDMQKARDIMAYHKEQQKPWFDVDLLDVLLKVEEDIEYLISEISMLKLNHIAEDLKDNG
tara:strand:+ start:899 stop:1225 length:327 start_codon:yes stop_codon:yes gene_type:complete